MTAILGGVGAACCWTVAMLCSSRASRVNGAGPALAWVMLVGLAIVVPFVLASGSPPTGSAAKWLLLAGTGNLGGLLLEYSAVRTGKVGVVASIASTEGAVTAVIAAIAGEPIATAVAAVLALIAGGIVLASLGENHDRGEDRPATRAVLLALGAALAFGVGLYAAGHVSDDVALPWVVLPARLLGVAVVAIPLASVGRIRIARASIPLVVAAGVAEVLGIASFALGARDAIGVTSVLGSQFAAFAAVGAYFLFGERLRRVQVAGVAAILVGVVLLPVLRA
ncbi:MAG: EamA family transporter [Actinomycetota bacterium]